ncbi:MAG: hypothetical protein ACOX0L_08015 [Natronincolaceae bacterium]|jgi:hypothetical protein|nr:hypothetical protein [Clostridiales bacterium]
MVLLIILAITGYIIFGYFIMNKIDIFIEKDVINTGTDYVDKKSTGGKSLLLFGNNELAKSVVKYCNDKDIELKFIEYYNELDFGYEYSLLLALSNNDVDNLMISAIGKKVCSIPHIVSLCNNNENLKIYDGFDMEKVITLDNDIGYMFNLIKEVVDSEI